MFYDNGGQCGQTTSCTLGQLQLTEVPEPQSVLVLLAGLGAMGAALGAARWRWGARQALSA